MTAILTADDTPRSGKRGGKNRTQIGVRELLRKNGKAAARCILASKRPLKQKLLGVKHGATLC